MQMFCSDDERVLRPREYHIATATCYSHIPANKSTVCKTMSPGNPSRFTLQDRLTISVVLETNKQKVIIFSNIMLIFGKIIHDFVPKNQVLLFYFAI